MQFENNTYLQKMSYHFLIEPYGMLTHCFFSNFQYENKNSLQINIAFYSLIIEAKFNYYHDAQILQCF